MAYCKEKGSYGSKYCQGPAPSRTPLQVPNMASNFPPIRPAPGSARRTPMLSNRPTAQQPRCGTMFANRGFTCCCKGLAGCPPEGHTFFKNRAQCCKAFGNSSGRCYGDAAPVQLQSRFPGGPRQIPTITPQRPTGPVTSGTLPPTPSRRSTTSSRQPKQRQLRSRFPPGGPSAQMAPDYQGVTDSNPTVYQFPGGERMPSGDGQGQAPPPATQDDTSQQKDAKDFIKELCPAFAWMPISKDCNVQVLAGAAVVVLGGALLIKMLKGRWF
jgi:hypothetical protein